MKRLAYLTCLYLLFIGCKKDDSPSTFSNALITSLKFEAAKNPGLRSDVIADIEDGRITASLPLGISKDSLVATFSTSDAVSSVDANGVVQISGVTVNNFSGNMVWNVRNRANQLHQYSLTLLSFTGLPIVYITTTENAPILTKTDYVTGEVKIESNSSSLASLPASPMQIKLRGNSTMFLPKKPYKIKLNTKASVLGMPSDKEWVLLANYTDKTLLRNYLAFEASKIFGMPYTPRSQFVEVFINGEHQGNYQLCEQVKIASSRMNIKEMDETDLSASKITGGYFMEIDSRLDEPNNFTTTRGVPITIKSPDFGVPAQNEYIRNYMQQLEDNLFSPIFADRTNGYAKFLNPETVINWFWVNELFKNIDAQFNSSIYMYKDRGGILNFGPVWDFDVAGGNNYQSGTDNPEGWYVREAIWFKQLFKDPNFTSHAISNWQAVRAQLNSLSTLIDNMALNLKYSQSLNFRKWNILGVFVWPNAVVLDSYDKEVNYLKSWLTKRINWIDANLQTIGE